MWQARTGRLADRPVLGDAPPRRPAAQVKAFWSLFATKDQKEGMAAFAEKRKPNFADE